MLGMVDLEVQTSKKYITVNEAKNIIGCSKNKMYKIIKLDGFPKIRIGKNYYIHKELFDKWQKENLYCNIHI